MQREQPQFKIESGKVERDHWRVEQESGQVYRQMAGDEKEELKVGVYRDGNVNGITDERDESGLPTYGQAIKS